MHRRQVDLIDNHLWTLTSLLIFFTLVCQEQLFRLWSLKYIRLHNQRWFLIFGPETLFLRLRFCIHDCPITFNLQR